MQESHLKIAQQIIQKLSDISGTTILTPNLRLTNYLQQLINQCNQLTLKSNCWKTPRIIPLAQWLTLLWENIPNSTNLLNNAQEYFLWEKIIKNSHVDYPLLATATQTKQITQNAVKAWNLLHDWQISLAQLAQSITTEETKYFHYWASKYKEYLIKHHNCSQAEIPQLLTNLLQDKQNNKNKDAIASLSYNSNKLLLIGFDDFSLTPQEKTLLQALANYAKYTIEYFDPNQQISQPQRLAVPNTDDEIYAMAQWAYMLNQQDANATIGCIVPHLQSCRDKIAKIFAETFANGTELLPQEQQRSINSKCDGGGYIIEKTAVDPSSLNLGKARSQRASGMYGVIHEECTQEQQRSINSKCDGSTINISLGNPLNEYPLIDSALTILSLGKENLPNAIWQKILATPFIKDNWLNNIATDKAREKIKTLNIFANNYFSFRQLSAILKMFCKELFNNIQQYKKTLASLTKPTLPAEEWIILFNAQLENFGWPGTRKLTSEELQTSEKWQKLCHEFRSLDLIYPSGLTYASALAKLTTLAQNTIFQPQSPQTKQAKINILGTLEAAGLNFDYLWIMSMNDQSWPPSPSPNSFLPLQLQRQLNMPNVSVARELAFCQTITQRWERSAQKIIYSYAKQNQENDSTNRLSPLLKNIPEITMETLFANFANQAKTQKTATIIHQLLKNKLEKFTDVSAPKVRAHEKIKGGTKLLQAQVACPFQAFATYRLAAMPSIIFSPKILRGNILHKALEDIWQNLKDSATLKAYSNNNYASLKQLIATAIDHSCKIVLQQQKQNWPARLLHLEKINLQNLLWQWLNIEKERCAFTVIQTEQKVEIIIGELPLSLRIDRVDQLANGKIIIIDYKTGKEIPSIKECLNIPPTATQLPLYGLALKQSYKNNNNNADNDNNIAALIFVHINRENLVKNPQFLAGIVDQVEQENVGMPLQQPQKKQKPQQQKHQQQQQQQQQKKNNKKWQFPNLKTTLAEWQTSLTAIAENFMQGAAQIDPCQPEVCQSCSLQTLCRVSVSHCISLSDI